MIKNFLKSFSPNRMKGLWRSIFLGGLIGLVSGLGAILFNFLLDRSSQFFMKDLPALLFGEGLRKSLFLGVTLERVLMIFIPCLGGLFSGLLVFRFAPEAEGHGTDAMIDSFHRKKGVIRRRVPFVKTLASAITIGSGGSAGKEGPIAQIGSGFASFAASLLNMEDRDRRIMLLAGAAGGIGAIFKAPLGAALFAAEVLYRKPEFEYEALIPSVLSSIIAYSVFTLYSGWGTIFQVPQISPVLAPSELLIYALFGILCALVGFFYIHFFYGMRDRFFKPFPLQRSLKPALGGVMLGIVAFFFPQVLGGGYGWIQSAIDGNLATGTMFLFAVAKIVATTLTISSGGSGGVFAPSLFIGAMLGGFYGHLASSLFPHLLLNPSSFVLVGMGGFFGGVAKAPLASLIMVAEMSGGYSLIVPLLVVSTISYLLLGEVSLYEKQVSTRVDSPAHFGEFYVNLLQHIPVKHAVPEGRNVEWIPEEMRLDRIIDRMVNSNQMNFPVLDKEGLLTGILSLSDVKKVMFDQEVQRLVVAKDIATVKVLTVTPEDSLHTALKKMTEAEIRELPVVSQENPRKIVSLVSRKDIIRVYHEQVERLDRQRTGSSGQFNI